MNHYDHYDGDDLGALQQRPDPLPVWAPTALHEVKTLSSGHEGEATVFEMEKDTGGTWVKTLAGDYHGVYYTYQVATPMAILRWSTLRQSGGGTATAACYRSLPTNPEG